MILVVKRKDPRRALWVEVRERNILVTNFIIDRRTYLKADDKAYSK